MSRAEPFPVSPNNPCPFLRALVAGGHISGHIEQLSTIANTIVAAGGATAAEPQLPKSKVYLIAMIANGLGPVRIARSVRKGAQLDAAWRTTRQARRRIAGARRIWIH